MEFVSFFMFIAWNALVTNLTFGKERDRTMLFPDYFFFAERRLVNHVVETKHVKDLDYCELFCYMNDNCVSANFKKEPEAGEIAHVCGLNNATHLDFDTDLITDADFYYRGSKNACEKNSSCKNNAICQSGFTVKGYRCLCPPGYEGGNCEKDIDECAARDNKCTLGGGTCENTAGSYNCICQFGHYWDGSKCVVDACQLHTVLHDDDRAVSHRNNHRKCDNNLNTGWYRFLNISGIRMPTKCPRRNRCNADFPGWLDGDHPTVDEGEVKRTVCFTRGSGQCCKKESFIRVKNCSSFYVYHLVQTSCPYRYCFTYN